MTSRMILASRQIVWGRQKPARTLARTNQLFNSRSTRIRSFTSLQRRTIPVPTRQYLPRCAYLSLSTLPLDLTLSLYSQAIAANTLPPPPSALAVPLACSSAIIQDEQRILTRIASRIKTFLQRLWEAITVTARSAQVALRLSPLIVLTPAAILSAKLHDSDEPTRLSNLSWWYFLHAIQNLGPAFVKLAQWASTRR